MVGIVKWLRPRVVAPVYVSSNLTIHPIRSFSIQLYMTQGYRQAVRQWILIPSCAGSNPATLANKKARSKCFGSFAISREFSDCNAFSDSLSVHVSAVRCTQIALKPVYVQLRLDIKNKIHIIIISDPSTFQNFSTKRQLHFCSHPNTIFL